MGEHVGNDGLGPLYLLCVLLEDVCLGAVAARLRSLGVLRGMHAEIVAEPKLVAAQPEMDVVTPGAANPSGEAEADGPAASATAEWLMLP